MLYGKVSGFYREMGVGVIKVWQIMYIFRWLLGNGVKLWNWENI